MIEADAVLLKWSDELWLTLIDECVAHVDKTITFKFKKPYSYAEEDNLVNEIHKLYDDNKLIVEYTFEIGIFKRRWFDSINKEKIKFNKLSKKILRIFNYNKLLYYNKKNITLQKDLIEKNKLTDIDNRMVKLYFSKDYTKRIQIYKTNNIFSYIFEELVFREEVE